MVNNKSPTLNIHHPVRTWLVKDVYGLLSAFVALLFNTSLVSGCFPSDFKEAVIRHVLDNKKTVLLQGNRAMPQLFFSA